MTYNTRSRDSQPANHGPAVLTTDLDGHIDARPGTALVVDDDRTIRSLCRVLLERMGFQVTLHDNGADALNALRNTNYNLLLVDLRLPDMDGTDLLELFGDTTVKPAIIAITGHASVEDTARITLLGAQGILLKPFDADELIAVVNEVLRKRQDAVAAAQSAAFHPLLGLSERLLSELDLSRLSDLIVTTAQDELQADRAILLQRDERSGTIRVVATAGAISAEDAAAHTSVAAWVTEQRRPLLLPSAAGTPPNLHLDAPLLQRSLVCVPLQVRGRVLGALHADKANAAAPFTRTNQELLTLLAGQGAIALENAQLYTLAQHRAQRLQKLNALSIALAAALDLTSVVAITGQHLSDDLPIIAGRVQMRQTEEHDRVHQYTFNAATPNQINTFIHDPNAQSGTVATVQAQPRMQRAGDLARPLDPWYQHHLISADQVVLSVPLSVEQRVLGVLEVISRTGMPAGQDELHYLAAIAAPLAMAIQRSQMHMAIVRSEARYRALLEHARDAVLVLNSTGQLIVDANPAATTISGYPHDDLIGMPSARLLSPWPNGEELSQTRHQLQRGTEIEANLHTHEGEDVLMAVVMSEVTHDGDQFLLCIARDISDRQRLAQRLIQTEKLAGMGRLAASIAHEINNPLHGLHNSIDLLTNHNLTTDKRTQLLGKAREESNRLISIVQGMLDFYRPAVEGMRPISLHEVLEQVLTLANPQLHQSNIVVERRWDANLPRVVGVTQHLRQVFLSLVLNAVDALDTGGCITISTGVNERFGPAGRRMAIVEFRDTGVGIPESEINKIFEPFYTSRTDRTGLGLAISYTIIEKHQGTITAKNTAHGTLISVALPVAEG